MTLQEFFEKQHRAAVAFSGGVDSAYLLYAAKQAGADVTAYYVKTQFQPEFEYEDAMRLSEELSVPMKVLAVDILKAENVRENPCDRCYYCKKAIFEGIVQAAEEDGYSTVLDGTNASDDADDRPGMRALKELSIRSPLRECKLTKEQIRRLSKEAGLFTWDKPAYACLATRVPAGEALTEEKLKHIEAAETYLAGLGFYDFRVRTTGAAAKLQVKSGQFALAVQRREEIVLKLKEFYDSVVLDMEGRA